MGTHWGTYSRISSDAEDTKVGVSTQNEDTARAVAALGGTVHEIYVENDTSAWKKRQVTVTDPTGRRYVGYRVIRPVWHQALHDLRTKRIAGLMVYNLDRLARDPRDLEDAIEVVEHYGARILSATNSEVDLTTDGGVMAARLLVAMANKSSADTSRRVARAHLRAAQSGRPVSGSRPFGWKADGATVEEAEAALIRKAATDLLAGVPVRRIADEWNAAGATTPRGKAWSGNTVRQLLRSPRLAGWRVHRPKGSAWTAVPPVAVDADGAPVRGLWEPILDDATHAAIVATFAKPETRVRVPRRGARHYLLSGLLRCGRCNAVMYGNRRDAADGKGTHYYACKDNGHVNSASGRAVDELVAEIALQHLAAVDLDRPKPEFAGEARLAQVQEQIAELMAAFTAGTLTGAVVFPAVQALEAERDALAAERATVEAAALGPDLTKLDRAAWEAMDTDRQRAVLEKLFDAVLVRPKTRNMGNRFDGDRLEVVWRR